ncbi:MAG: hypothetical protein LBQ88_08670 [Treponema sp.]|jgi:hypothetical protein|nr:hypothetical protein [Treponema sp.]
MAQNNDKPGNADPSKENNDIIPAAAASGRDPVIDIKKYLQKAKIGKSAAGLLEVLFKEKTFKASEWPAKVEETLGRQVKR